MDSEDWIDARRRKDDVEEFEVAESRSKSAMKRLKELAREKISKTKNKFLQNKDSTIEGDKLPDNEKDIPQKPVEVIYSDPDSDEYDFFSQAGWKKRKNTMNLDGEWESKKKKKKKKKKVKLNIKVNIKFNMSILYL